ncbi:IPT/TIG domain-containing protein [Bdellovibrio bacteriovorus]|uniref:IPT/TIG domain-containing protein n=1 Tax=Bdellovibrio bacteriovorus TaxID=959 RepID=UPI0021CF4541|nr:IPT/TIG domain-containing protein [Bdellovibrio bacteriovorus]UXR63261.1 IPT/TIG domain-containing protein [Bdellovibrio bacteriovorus]
MNLARCIRSIITFSFIFAFSLSAQAESLRFNYSAKLQNLISTNQQYSIAKVSMLPSNPNPGQKVSFAIEVVTGFEGPAELDLILSVSFNGQPLKSYHRGGRLWVTEAVLIEAAGAFPHTAQLFVQNRNESEFIQKQLIEAKTDIESLNRQISQETDPARKAYLESQRDIRQSYVIDLQNSLEALKRPVASKTTVFDIGHATTPVDQPSISAVDPSYGSKDGGQQVIITGENLEETTKLLFGGEEIPFSSLVITGTSITFTTPASTEGAKEVILESTSGGSTVTTRLKNAYIAIEVQTGGPVGPAYPVAFAGVPKDTPAEVPVQLDGSASYSPDEAALTYLWTVVTKPAGAGTQDGVLDDATLVNPSFSATVSGTYVVSLVVSNGVKQSAPSLTVVTVGPKDPVTLTPSQISGVVSKDGVYIGSFRACNNLQSEMRYQLFNANRIVLISGFKRGVIAKGNCQTFQFSVTNYGTTTLNFDIPFVVQNPVHFTKILNIEVAPVAATALSLLTGFSASQWAGEQDLEVLSQSSYVPLFGTYDEAAETFIVIRNDSSSAITITQAPVITHLNGSAGVFSADLPTGGIEIPANDQVLFPILVSPGTFIGNIAEAMLEWETEINGPSRVLMLQTYKLAAPTSQAVTVDFGEHEAGYYPPGKYLRVPSDFLGSVAGFAEVSSITVTDDDNGDFYLDLTSWPGSMLVGNIDYIRSTGIDLRADFENFAAGVYQGKVQVKVKGYQTPFEYTCDLTLVAPEEP